MAIIIRLFDRENSMAPRIEVGPCGARSAGRGPSFWWRINSLNYKKKLHFNDFF